MAEVPGPGRAADPRADQPAAPSPPPPPRARPLPTSPSRRIISIVLILILFIVGCVVASSRSGHSGATHFAAVWSVLIAIFVAVAGTHIFRRMQSQLAIGFLLGVITMLANQFLIMTAVLGSKAQDNGDSDNKSADSAYATFAFFLALVYAIFAAILAVFREDVIKKEDVSNLGNNTAGVTTAAPAPAATAVPPSSV